MKPLLLALFVFVSVTILTQYLAYQRYLIAMDVERDEVIHEVNAIKERIKASLIYSLSATKTLAFLVKEYGVPAEFDSVAKEIIESNKHIDALELTKGGEITHVYPLEGNAGAIGYNVLDDSLRKTEAYKAIERRELFFAGPFELKQGGMAVVGRLPIFIDNKFFGFSVVLIKLSTLLKAAGLDQAENKDFYYQLSKINPFTGKEEFFLPEVPLLHNGNFASIKISDGEWKLHVTPKEKSNGFFTGITLSVLGLILSLTGSFLTWYLVRQPEKLKRLIEVKTLQLATSERYFRSLIEKSADAIVLLDKSGNVLYQSDSTEKISGYSIDEIQSLNGIELIHPDDREEDAATFAVLVLSPGIALNRTHRFKHKNGNYIWLEGTYSNLLNDESVRAIVYNYHDVTQRKEFEQQVANAHKETETTLNRINDSVVSVDKEWRYTFLNEAALATHPPGKAALGKKMLEIHPAMSGTTFWEKYQEAMRTKIVCEVEDYYAPMDTWFMVRIYPSEDGLTIFYTDITDRKKAEQEIVMEKNFSVSVINSLPGVFYLYDRAGKFIRWNKNFEIVSGYDSEAIRNMHPLDFFCIEEKHFVKEKIERVFTVGHSDVTALFCTKSGGRIPYYFNGRKANLNGIDYLIGMGIDITDRVKAEDDLRERTEEIQELTVHMERIREEERTRMSREIHDELGQQLTGLKMDTAWVIRKIIPGEQVVREKLSGMISLIDETMRTVRRIASELRPGILDDLGLIPTLEWQTSEFERRTGIKSEFQTVLNDFLPEREHATNIFRIYQEALTNIARHAHASSVKTVLEQRNGHVHLIIKDDGLGFDMNEIGKKNSLGLVGMKERARIIQGELAIERGKTKGTIITLRVPVTINSERITP